MSPYKLKMYFVVVKIVLAIVLFGNHVSGQGSIRIQTDFDLNQSPQRQPYQPTTTDFDETLEEKCAALYRKLALDNKKKTTTDIDLTTTELPDTTTAVLPEEQRETIVRQNDHGFETTTQAQLLDSPSSSRDLGFETTTQAQLLDSPSTKSDESFETTTQAQLLDSPSTKSDKGKEATTQTQLLDSPSTKSDKGIETTTQTQLLDSPSTKSDEDIETTTQKQLLDSPSTKRDEDLETTTQKQLLDSLLPKSDEGIETTTQKQILNSPLPSSNEGIEITTQAQVLDFSSPNSDESLETTTQVQLLDSPSQSTGTNLPPAKDKLGEPARRGKELDITDANLVIDSQPSASTDALLQLIKDLTKKIENLEATQRVLNANIDDLHKKLENSSLLHEKKEETTTDLVSGDSKTANEKWKQLSENTDSVEELGNVTKTIVEKAMDHGAPPTTVLDFVNEIPNPQVQETAYSTIADKMNGSDVIQEQMYWRDMSPYCRQAADNIGHNNPSTLKMYSVQNQVRLNAARPIAQCSTNIQHQEYQPAVTHWMTMVRDIPDSPPQLENNMKRMMIRTYNGNPINLPFAFHFILILPPNHGYFKQVAYRSLTQEMKANGHYYNPNNQQQQQFPQ